MLPVSLINTQKKNKFSVKSKQCFYNNLTNLRYAIGFTKAYLLNSQFF